MSEIYIPIALLVASGAFVLWAHRRTQAPKRDYELLKRFEEETGRSSAEAMAELTAKRLQKSHEDIE